MADLDATASMTVDDWERLRLLAYREASRRDDLGTYTPDEIRVFDALADKCQARAEALRAGRVMP